MYKVIVFDFFGVIQNDQYSVWLNKHSLQKKGEFADISVAADKDFISMSEFYEDLGRLSGIDAKEIEAEFEEPQHIDGSVVEIIKKLYGSYKLALASNSNSDYLKQMMHRHKLEELFDYVIISGEVGYSKPSLEFFEYLLSKLDILPSEIIFIDDSKQNVLSAQSLGIKSVQYRDAMTLREELLSLGLSL